MIENELKKQINIQAERFFSPGYLLQETRFASSKITDHIKITKDKYGEPYLNLLLLRNTLNKNQLNLNRSTFAKSYTFNIYVVARVYKILTLIQALHEDLRIEFNDLLNELGYLFGLFPFLMKVSINNQLDPNWLLSGEIPDDIVGQQKELRAMGLLK